MQNFKSTPDSLKQIFKVFGRKPSLGATVSFRIAKIPLLSTFILAEEC